MTAIKKYYGMSEDLLVYARDGEINNPNATTMQAMQAYMVQNGEALINLINMFMWQPETSYAVGAIVQTPDMPKGLRAVCTVAGVSSPSEPTWPTTANETVIDNTVTWQMQKINYILPTASNSVLGGIKIGSNLSFADGILSLSKGNVTSAMGKNSGC